MDNKKHGANATNSNRTFELFFDIARIIVPLLVGVLGSLYSEIRDKQRDQGERIIRIESEFKHIEIELEHLRSDFRPVEESRRK